MAKAAYLFLQEGKTPSLAEIIEKNLTLLGEDRSRLYAIVENVDVIYFDIYERVEQPANWVQGRVFGPQGELRWRRSRGLTHLVLITDLETANLMALGFEGCVALPSVSGDDGLTEYYLWGENQHGKGVWLEGRIPKPLHYPLAFTAKCAKMRVREYRNERGVVEFVRYVEVIPA